MRYIDFDGVILDTEDALFEEWRKIPNRKYLPEEEKIKYMRAKNWKRVLNESEIINDAIEKLKAMDVSKTAILTTVHSFRNEALAKLEYLRDAGVEQSIIFVPHFMHKTDIVNAKGNILIDDGLHNLVRWEEAGGYPIFFDIDHDDIDTWGRANTMLYQRTDQIDVERRKRSI